MGQGLSCLVGMKDVITGLSPCKGKKVLSDLEALSGLSLKKAMICLSQGGTIAQIAEGLRQNKGSRGSFQQKNRPLNHVPVGAFSPKAVQWSKEEQVKSVLAPFCPYVGSTPKCDGN
jgi:hypothetical protein